MKCSKCGKEIAEDSVFCGFCGAKINKSTEDGGISYPPQPPMSSKPDNFLVWSILATIFCCLPFGIVAIVKSSTVDKLWYSGDYKGAQDAADSARTWFWWSFGVGLFVLIVYFIIQVFAIAAL